MNTPSIPGQFAYDVEPTFSQDLSDRLMRLERHTVDGEHWVVSKVLESELDSTLVDWDRERLANHRPDEPSFDGPTVWHPESWNTESCLVQGITPQTVRTWSGESRVQVTAPFTDRQMTAVELRLDTPEGIYVCSGALLRRRWVLTAAHCIFNPSGALIAPLTGLTVHSRADSGNPRSVDSAVKSQSWGPIATFAQDWALVEMSSGFPLIPTGITMDLYSGSDSAFQDIGAAVNLLGFPVATLPSGQCSDSPKLHRLGDAEVSGTTTDSVRFWSDGTGGQSGAPYYFCPEGNAATCTSGQIGHVIAVHAGYNSVIGRYVGPKASSFRAEALTVLP